MKYVLITILSFLAIGGGSSFLDFSFDDDSYGIGEKVESFAVMGTDGKTYTLNQYSDKKAIAVIFTTNHCPYAKLYEDRIIAIQSKYADKGVQILAINPNDASIMPEDSFDEMVVRAKEKNFNFPYLQDTKKIFTKFGAKRTPEVFLLNTDFELVYHGAIDDNARDASAVETKYLENAIDAVLSNTKIDPNDTKAIGCSIKQ